MSNLLETVVGALIPGGWREVEPGDRSQVPVPLLTCEFGAVSVRVAESPEQVAARWTSWQADLAATRDLPEVGPHKDLYLLVLLQSLPPTHEAQIEAIGANTNVCRKLFVVQGSRSVEDVVDDLTLLGVARRGEDGPSAESPDEALLTVGLDEAVLRDLNLRSPEVIATHVVEGRYGGRDDVDAAE